MFNKTKTVEVKATISYRYLYDRNYCPFEATIIYDYDNKTYKTSDSGYYWKDAKNRVIDAMKKSIINDKRVPPTENVIIKVKIKK